MEQKAKDPGKISRLGFYVCQECGNVVLSAGSPAVSCCSGQLKKCAAADCDEEHTVMVEKTDDEYSFSFSHPMDKDHYISFACLVSDDRYFFLKLYPEGGSQFRMPRFVRRGTLYLYCSRDGLFRLKIS